MQSSKNGISPGREKVSHGKPTEKSVVFIKVGKPSRFSALIGGIVDKRWGNLSTKSATDSESIALLRVRFAGTFSRLSRGSFQWAALRQLALRAPLTGRSARAFCGPLCESALMRPAARGKMRYSAAASSSCASSRNAFSTASKTGSRAPLMAYSSILPVSHS